MKLNEAVYAVLRNNLDQGLIVTGSPLRETEVARILSVGRVPVRAALTRLAEEGVLEHIHRRGFFVPGHPGRDLPALHLEVSEELREHLMHRNMRTRHFDRIEMDIAAALAFGTFRINESRLAEHLDVSRTVAREFLGSLDRIGLVTQLSNGRWQAQQLSPRDISDHYALRRALEPLALIEAMPLVSKALVGKALATLERALENIANITLDDLLRLEKDLHVDLVQATPNRHMADVIRRSQLLMTSTNISFATTGSVKFAAETVTEHLEIFRALKTGDMAAATNSLDRHLLRAEDTTQQQLSQLDLGLLPDRPAFLEPVLSETP